MEAPLKAAIVGCGIISRQHIEGFAHSDARARIVALCDTDRAKAETALESYHAAIGRKDQVAVLTDYAQVLADPYIEAVDLLLPHHLHADMAVAAARAGKHILCEKPLALTLEDCDRMAAAACGAGVVLMHGENMRLAEFVEQAAGVIRSGRLGTLVGLQATYAHWQSTALNQDWRTRPDESGGGHLMDGAIHFVDILRHLGGEISHVQAMATRFRPELGAESEDTGVLNFRYAAGHLGQMFACHASRGRGASPMLTVFGTEGCLSLSPLGAERPLVVFPHGAPQEAMGEQSAWQRTFDREIAHFIGVIRDGVPLRATPADGRANVQVILAAYESIRTRREVAIDPA